MERIKRLIFQKGNKSSELKESAIDRGEGTANLGGNQFMWQTDSLLQIAQLSRSVSLKCTDREKVSVLC